MEYVIRCVLEMMWKALLLQTEAKNKNKKSITCALETEE